MFLIFTRLNNKICKYIYYRIIKSLITEYIYLIKEFNKSNYINTIEKNILEAMKEINDEEKYKKSYKKSFIIIEIIEFFSKDQIKNDIDKTIYISITGYVIIYSLNFDESLRKPEELFKVINKEKLKFHPKNIAKLKCFNSNSNINKNEENNYFLICSSLTMNKALIINVTNNFQSIKTVQTINVCKGMISSVEFNYDGYYYLLSAFKSKFFLWFCNEKKLENKELEPKCNLKGKTITNFINKKYKPILFIMKVKNYL